MELVSYNFEIIRAIPPWIVLHLVQLLLLLIHFATCVAFNP